MDDTFSRITKVDVRQDLALLSSYPGSALAALPCKPFLHVSDKLCDDSFLLRFRG